MFNYVVVRWSNLAPEPKRIFETDNLDKAHEFILKEIDRLITIKSDYNDTVHLGITGLFSGLVHCAEVDMHA